ncbi:MAG: prolipoprotein diacylglyceryl transferase [Desulfovibrio sp.]|nr:prolipoprotein diacylglyceryl transferase [Desulfovibrio sp.]
MVHTLSPVALTIGSFELRWYGLMYLAGFLLGWYIGRLRAKRVCPDWHPQEVDDLLTFSMLAVVIGGRLGYVLFYDLPHYLHEPLDILRIWNGGMSFHGGLLGVLCAFWYFAKTRKKSFLQVSDFVAPLVPQAIFFGRLGNFINGELWGKATDLPWGVIFPGAGPFPRHPSQLYEAFFEGIVLSIILLCYAKKPRPAGTISGLFAMGYALFRSAIECIRIPDAQLGYLAFGWLTMGQVLCIPLFCVGLWLFLRPQPSRSPIFLDTKH